MSNPDAFEQHSNGKWYWFDGNGLTGPFDTKQEAEEDMEKENQ